MTSSFGLYQNNPQKQALRMGLVQGLPDARGVVRYTDPKTGKVVITNDPSKTGWMGKVIKPLAIAGLGAGFGIGALGAIAPETAASLGVGAGSGSGALGGLPATAGGALTEIPESVAITPQVFGSNIGGFLGTGGLGAASPITSSALPDIGGAGAIPDSVDITPGLFGESGQFGAGAIPNAVDITPGGLSGTFGSPESILADTAIPSESDLGITPQVFGSSPGSFLNPSASSGGGLSSLFGGGDNSGGGLLSKALGLGSGGSGIGGSPLAQIAGGLVGAFGNKPVTGPYPGPESTAATRGPLFDRPLPPTSSYLNRTPVQNYQPIDNDWYHWGEKAGQPQFYNNNKLNFPSMARGGALNRSMARGGGGHGYVEGAGDGMQDAIPAKLSDGEFVINADVVSALGNGSNRKGAQRLEEMRRQVMRDRGTPRVVPKKIRKSPLQYLQAAKGGRR